VFHNNFLLSIGMLRYFEENWEPCITIITEIHMKNFRYCLNIFKWTFAIVHSISSYSSHTNWEWSSSVFEKYFITLCFISSLFRTPRLISVRQRYKVLLQNVCTKSKFWRWGPGVPTLYGISRIRRCQFLSMFLWLSGEWVNIIRVV
jgi:hypothetical protein